MTAPSPARSAPAPRGAAWRGAFVLLFAAWSLAYLVTLSQLASAPYDGDSLMRLQQVRDLLAGQSWFDVTQHRMNPPAGALMHWSRIVDIPLAAFQLLLRPLLGRGPAEYATAVLVPLAYLAGAITLLRALMLRLGLTEGEALGGLALTPLFPQLPAAFAPMQIDHHAPQALAALALAVLLIGPARRRAAVGAGAVAACWLVISLEGLPLVALVAGLCGLDYVRRGSRMLMWFLAALAACSTVFSLATRPLSDFREYCDILLPAHWAVFAIGAGLAALLPLFPGQRSAAGRFAALAVVPLVCGPFALATLGSCARDPMGGFDPLVRRYWFDTVAEGLPLWVQPWPAALPVLYTAALICAGLWAARRRGLWAGSWGASWPSLGAYAIGTILYAMVLARQAMPAQLLTIPFAAVLFAEGWPRARSLASAPARIAASVACLLMVTPAPAAVAAHALASPKITPAIASGIASAQSAEPLAPCDFHSLTVLPPGLIMTTFNAAPAILVQSGHSVTIGGYHRNAAALHRSIATFVSPPDRARELLARQGARYMAVCLDDSSLATMAEGNPDSLAAALLAGRIPHWLQPVSNLKASRLAVYRVAADTVAPTKNQRQDLTEC